MMDDATQRELAALADGTLRRPETRLSPELAQALATQRAARAAIQAATVEPAPAALRAAVAAMVAEAPARRRRRPAIPGRLGGAFARRALAVAGAATAVLVAAVLATAPQGPSVADAAQLALAPARAAAPPPRGDGTLAAAVDGVAYPYWERWRATGTRRDVVRGRAIRTVFYADGGRRIGYAIAAGAPLPVHGGTTVARGGVRLRVLHAGAATVVTWLRHGHTCVLAARDVDATVLIRLAVWGA
jgi:hypothetical protein